MSKVEWLNSDDPTRMLEFYSHCFDERKLRLFGIACVLRWGVPFQDKRATEDVQKADLLAEGQLNETERRIAEAVSINLYREASHISVMFLPILVARKFDLRKAISSAAQYTEQTIIGSLEFDERLRNRRSEQAELLRKIVGNPFRQPHVDPSWRTDDVKGLALAAYDNRSTDSFPMLHDALLEAGCDNEEILNYCRTEREVIRGHWKMI